MKITADLAESYEVCGARLRAGGSGKPTSGKVEVCCDASCSSPTLLHTWNVDGSAYGPDDDEGYQAYNFQFDNRGSGRYFRFDFDGASGTDPVHYTPVSLELFQCLEVSSVACEDTGGTLPGGQVVPVEQCAIFSFGGNCNTLDGLSDICPVSCNACSRRLQEAPVARQLSEASGFTVDRYMPARTLGASEFESNAGTLLKPYVDYGLPLSKSLQCLRIRMYGPATVAFEIAAFAPPAALAAAAGSTLVDNSIPMLFARHGVAHAATVTDHDSAASGLSNPMDVQDNEFINGMGNPEYNAQWYPVMTDGAYLQWDFGSTAAVCHVRSTVSLNAEGYDVRDDAADFLVDVSTRCGG